VRGGLAHREHDYEQADPCGHDDQYDNTQIHLSLPRSRVPKESAPVGDSATRLPAIANDRTASEV
jgi:hypothetical protein